MGVDWERVRGEFPSLRKWTFLNTAEFGQMPRSGVEAHNRHFEHRDELACSDFLSWFDDADRIRVSIARLIECQPNDVAFIPNASEGLAALLHGITWKTGDQVLTLEGEFPNNLYAPYFSGLEFIETPWERFFDAITPRTRLVLLSMLNYATGFRPPLEEIAPYLRARDILLYVDGTQGLGALRFPVSRFRPAMLAVHGYKWMASPVGAGFMYVDPELQSRMVPRVIGWRSDRRWREVGNLHHGKPEFKDSAERFEGGMVPFSLLYAMEQSIELMLQTGTDRIEGRTLALADGVRSILRDAGAEVADGATTILAGRFPQHDAARIARDLKTRGVLVSARRGHLRVSAHLYNNEADLARFAEELRHCMTHKASGN